MLRGLFIFALILGCTVTADGAVITFDGFAPGASGTPKSESGFTFTYSIPGNASNGIANSLVGNASRSLVFGGGNTVTITSDAPLTTFSISSIGIGPTSGSLGAITFSGVGNGNPSNVLAAGTNSFTTLGGAFFTGFTGLTSLTISTNAPGNVVGLDNVNLTASAFSAVPEPGSFALIGAIGAFGVWRRRRSQKVE